jgi:Ran GTPase-activating protein (RanGAP) involved in mRNA processing and transport
MEDAHYLVESIIKHPTIDKIRLDGCFGEEVNENDVLCSLLASDKNFAEIDLDNNNIQTDGISEISDYLAIDPPLKELYLRNNDLNDEDASLIARALKHNTNLQWLSLDENNITRNGSTVLRDAVYYPTSLNSLSDCNHTCRSYGLSWGGDVPVNLPGLTSKQNRARKIYHLLSLRNKEGNNVHHLNLEFGDEGTRMMIP